MSEAAKARNNRYLDTSRGMMLVTVLLMFVIFRSYQLHDTIAKNTEFQKFKTHLESQKALLSRYHGYKRREKEDA